MLIYLLRHGETTSNHEHRFQGQLDMPLSETGERQAHLLARRMAAVPGVGQLFCSTLIRARVTAQAVGEAMGLAARAIDGLQEIHVGQWAGQLARDVLAGPDAVLARKWLAGDAYLAPPGGESVIQVRDRTVAALRPCLDEAGADVAVVAHGISLKALICGLLDLPLEYGNRFHLRNASVSVLEYFPGKRAKLITLNDTCHLDEGFKDVDPRN